MEKSLANKVVDKMYNNDPFSLWLGIKRMEDGAGKSILQMVVRKEMLNGFGIAHGGITYSLADSALAFASNGHGKMSVSIETSISHLTQVKEGDILTTHVEELNLSNKIGTYLIIIVNQINEKVAIFKGTVYRTAKDWDV
jgi:acyl-CoA thioesterase